MTTPLHALGLLSLVIAFSIDASAQPSVARTPNRPRLVSKHEQKTLGLVEFEGKLSDASGNPLEGSFLLKFELYDAAEGGEKRWEESLYVEARSGRYRAELGRVKPIPQEVFAGAYRLIVSPPEGTGWLSAGVKPPKPVSAKEEPAPVRQAAAEGPAPAPPRQVPERPAPVQMTVEAPEPAPPDRPKGGAVYQVRPGDTLRSVALKLYGNPDRWVELYQANDDRILRGGDLIPGQKLIVPGEGGKALR